MSAPRCALQVAALIFAQLGLCVLCAVLSYVWREDEVRAAPLHSRCPRRSTSLPTFFLPKLTSPEARRPSVDAWRHFFQATVSLPDEQLAPAREAQV